MSSLIPLCCPPVLVLGRQREAWGAVASGRVAGPRRCPPGCAQPSSLPEASGPAPHLPICSRAPSLSHHCPRSPDSAPGPGGSRTREAHATDSAPSQEPRTRVPRMWSSLPPVRVQSPWGEGNCPSVILLKFTNFFFKNPDNNKNSSCHPCLPRRRDWLGAGFLGRSLARPRLQAHRPRFQLQLCCLKAVSPPAHNLTSLCHGFLFKIIVTTPFFPSVVRTHTTERSVSGSIHMSLHTPTPSSTTEIPASPGEPVLALKWGHTFPLFFLRP